MLFSTKIAIIGFCCKFFIDFFIDFFRTVRIVKTIRTIKTIKTITRSGVIVVRGRRNCLKGLTGLNFFRTVRIVKTVTRSGVTVLSVAVLIVLKVSQVSIF